MLLPTLEVGVKSATKCGYEIATENDRNFTHPGSKTRRGRVGRSVPQTLDCACNQGVIEPKIYQTDRGYNKGGEKDICPTITINSWEHNNHLIDSFRIRRLIPLECGLLTGMRKEDIVIVVSDTQAYKIFGNAIEINCMRSIVRQLYRPVKSVLSLF